MNPVRILIFAKAPVPGRVKTRLIPALGPAGAALLASRLLQHTLTQARVAALGPVELCASPPLTDPDWAGQRLSLGIQDDAETRDSGRLTFGPTEACPPPGNAAPRIRVQPPLPHGLISVAQTTDFLSPSPLVGKGWGEGAERLPPVISEPLKRTGGLAPSRLETSDQGDGDLGARLARAARGHLDLGGRVILIGADCPGLSARHLREAAEALEDHEAALIPARDGGYVLLGLRTFDPSLFSDLPWSTSAVASLTLARIQALGWRVWIGEELVDIDEAADLGDLPEDLDPGWPGHVKQPLWS